MHVDLFNNPNRQAWNNFLNSFKNEYGNFPGMGVVWKALKEYNGRDIPGIPNLIVFDTEEDVLAFILKWS